MALAYAGVVAFMPSICCGVCVMGVRAPHEVKMPSVHSLLICISSTELELELELVRACKLHDGTQRV